VGEYVQKIKQELIEIKNDGSIWLNQDYFNYSTGLRMVHDGKWAKLFGFPRREAESQLEQHHCDMALAIQIVTEEIVIKMAEEAKRLTKSDNLCLAGGVALNCVANGKLQNTQIFKNIYIQPAAGDAGGALGAALAAYYIYFGKERKVDPTLLDGMKGAYLGPEFSDLDIKYMAKKYNAVYTYYDHFEKLAERTAKILAEGNVVGWFQGRMEFGPRALGNRSIIGDPRNAEMQKKLNLKIKYRESFRPFAPSVLMEDVNTYFKLNSPSPYMLLVQDVKEDRRTKLPSNYSQLPLTEKLYFLRSDLPSITHIDFSARIQTVHEQTNKRYHTLISAFKKETGYGVIVNTSFNVRGEPIVCTPEDAYKCLMRTEMDYLIINNCLFAKADQPEWKETVSWKEEFVLD
jgi:carbamoyltransferase